eukprot:14989778-Alexandrium_andersonii.AAC.1
MPCPQAATSCSWKNANKRLEQKGTNDNDTVPNTRAKKCAGTEKEAFVYLGKTTMRGKRRGGTERPWQT